MPNSNSAINHRRDAAAAVKCGWNSTPNRLQAPVKSRFQSSWPRGARQCGE